MQISSEFINHFKKHNLEFQNKDERYSETLAKKVLTSLGYMTYNRDKDTLLTINNDILTDIALDSKKVSKPITLDQFVNVKFAKTQYVKAYDELRQNWPDRDKFALIFDYHGDSIADMVMHNSASLVPEESNTWSFRLIIGEDSYYIQSLKSFLVTFGNRYKKHTD